jgi:hypothetical protein
MGWRDNRPLVKGSVGLSQISGMSPERQAHLTIRVGGGLADNREMNGLRRVNR